ncbi:MAG: PEP-CTERM sorting domain-containing protein [Phycisphaerae bacterium]|nr:PEP-CTERM sorting domain-containing protein [Phycisphaerae bacterium]
MCLLVLAAVAEGAIAAPIVLEDVPAYRWYHGCGPTAAACVFGYWDLHGYSNLFDAAGDDLLWTGNVMDQISSPEHNAKYDHEDDPNLPDPPMTSIADWFRTSVDPLDYGWSYLSYADDAFIGYASYRGYEFDSWYASLKSGRFGWQDLVDEIDAGRPMMFLVDTAGDGRTNHFVPVLGYDDRGDEGLWYGVYSVSWLGELENVFWYQFRPMSTEYTWGVSSGIFVQPVPEPLSVLLLTIGGIALARRRAG